MQTIRYIQPSITWMLLLLCVCFCVDTEVSFLPHAHYPISKHNTEPWDQWFVLVEIWWVMTGINFTTDWQHSLTSHIRYAPALVFIDLNYRQTTTNDLLEWMWVTFLNGICNQISYSVQVQEEFELGETKVHCKEFELGETKVHCN